MKYLAFALLLAGALLQGPDGSVRSHELHLVAAAGWLLVAGLLLAGMVAVTRAWLARR